ncbi:META domain-containing protein [Oceanospirillum beijerinckii]|uniref:META domain-containing protein n=1 Tax=Oceanospirillum beijerinckii TaxID=64976 RepID=UPI0004111F00|nr:META domain-containing protein [Oceanospirillum beijerinckii]
MSFTSFRSATITTLLGTSLLLSGCNLMQTQANSPINEPLQNTYWKLTSLNGQYITVQEGQREPHMILKQENRVQGYSGCNMFRGKFELKKEQIEFQPLLMTRRACIGDNGVEYNLMHLLQGDVKWSIQGQQLKLNHTESESHATFQAVHLQ